MVALLHLLSCATHLDQLFESLSLSLSVCLILSFLMTPEISCQEAEPCH